MNGNVGQPGDSGGPWFIDNTATGVHHGDCEIVNNRDAFTAIDYLDEALDVQVMKQE